MKALAIFAVLAALALPAAGSSEAAACLLAAGDPIAQQNPDCCKANKGICGCRAGKIVCCDKTFADGCPCAAEDAPPIS